LASIITKTYKDQSTWFLNAFWDSHSNEAERIWSYVKKCNEIDLEKHEQGNGLDEVRAHKFLESFGETLTVMALRESLRKTGDNAAEIAEAQRLLDSVISALEESDKQAQLARDAETEAR